MAFSMQRTSYDYDKYMDEYRANLQLQINNNAKIYNAVSQVNQGIQIPEAPPDMRSLSEKIGDVQNLKNQLSVLLRQITDGANADTVVNRLNDDQLVRAVQYFSTLASKLKSSYALGVPSDVFIQALNNYSELQDDNAGIDMGLQGLKDTSDKILLSLKNIADYGLKPTSIVKLRSLAQKRKIASQSQAIRLEELEKIMLSLDDLKRISQMDIEDKNEIEKQLTDIYPKLPTQRQFDNAVAQLEMIPDEIERKEAFDQLMQRVAITPEEIEVLKQYKGVKTRGGLRITGKTAVRMRKAVKKMEKEMASKKPAGVEPSEPAPAEPAPAPEEEEKKGEPEPKKPAGDLNSWQNTLKELRGALANRLSVLNKIQDANVGEFTYDNQPITLVSIAKGNIPGEEFKAGRTRAVKYWEKTNLQELYNKLPKVGGGKGIMRGCGLVQTKSEPKQEKKSTKAIRITGKIEKPMEYVPFGRYAVNKFKLNNGILMLRTKSNNTIPALAPQKVSKNIVDILKQIIIGGIPQFESISALDTSDKELLHKIVKLSHIDISVPTPDLTQKEKDHHRFQVLRGELFAGNSNINVINELKSLLLKFIANGSIPKNQANAVLYELMILSK